MKIGIFRQQKGMSKGVRSMRLYVHIVLIKDCVKVINKPCMRDARYVRLISWTLRCGSEQLSLFIHDGISVFVIGNWCPL